MKITKKEEMGSACSIHGTEDECISDFGEKPRRKNDTRKT
jgi:hypothetical protein